MAAVFDENPGVQALKVRDGGPRPTLRGGRHTWTKRKRAEARFPVCRMNPPAQYLLMVPSTSSAQALMPPVML
jgi:hypothetical protein